MIPISSTRCSSTDHHHGCSSKTPSPSGTQIDPRAVCRAAQRLPALRDLAYVDDPAAASARLSTSRMRGVAGPECSCRLHTVLQVPRFQRWDSNHHHRKGGLPVASILFSLPIEVVLPVSASRPSLPEATPNPAEIGTLATNVRMSDPARSPRDAKSRKPNNFGSFSNVCSRWYPLALQSATERYIPASLTAFIHLVFKVVCAPRCQGWVRHKIILKFRTFQCLSRLSTLIALSTHPHPEELRLSSFYEIFAGTNSRIG